MPRALPKVILISLIVQATLLPFALPGYAQPLVRMEIPSSFNPVGSGARALGMGGAFIAVADDATAASWNPGGLIQLENPEISVVGGYVQRTENNTFGSNPEASGRQSVDDIDLNYLSVAYPFRLANRNMIVSLNYQRLYDFDRNWNFTFDANIPLYTTPVAYRYEQKGALYALGLAYSAEITPQLSAGITLNYWGDFIHQNEWQQSYSQEARIAKTVGGVTYPGTYHIDKIESYGFSGWNANVGFLWKMTERWSLGGVFKTPFTASIDRQVAEDSTTIFPTVPPVPQVDFRPSRKKYSDELRMPMSYGLGLAYRFSDTFTVSADIYRTHWDDFIYENEQGVGTSAISGQSEGSSNISNTTWLRLGGEYLIIGAKHVVPIRAGIFYDPAPAEGAPDNFYGFALGTGIAYGRFIFDVAYQFRFGNGVGASQLRNLNFSQDVREHTLYASTIVHF